MTGRCPDEPHRAASPLELFFDLCFVVAVAQASDRLRHALTEGEVGHGIFGYLTVFFAIWWAWVNFTWFASAYDTDDVPYRITTLVQIGGALMLAAGIPPAFDRANFKIIIIGYVVMRLALVTQWLRVARSDLAHRRTALRYATGISLVQAGWVARLALPGSWRIPAFFVLVILELVIPIVAERTRPTTWHPHHLAERYGLFTMIMLGESVLAATLAVQAATGSANYESSELIPLAGTGLVTVFCLWWLYFDRPTDRLIPPTPRAFVWGEGHYLIFASAAAVGAGLAVMADHLTGRTHLTRSAAGYATAVPVAAYLLTNWLLQVLPYRRGPVVASYPVVALLVLLAPFAPTPVAVIAALLAALVAVTLFTPGRPEKHASKHRRLPWTCA